MSAESSLALADEAATLRLGAALAAGIGPGRVLHLSGELGLVELYVVSRLNLYHFDFYRFKDRREWLESGFREYFNERSACVVEWPERAGDLLAPPDLLVRLAHEAEGRRAWLSAFGAAGEDWRARSLRHYSSAP